jgi:HAD superfamily hydrolase (TIGR01509 family)
MEKPDTKAVMFDAGNVVVYWSNKGFQKKVCEVFDTDWDRAGLEVDYVSNIFVRGQISESGFWDSVSTRLNKPYDRKKVDGFFYNYFLETARPFGDVVDLVRKLRNSQYSTVLVSNTIPPHAEAMRKFDWFNEFDGHVLSCEVGSAKPEKRIYDEALKVAGAYPRQTIFIDDHEEFVRAARSLYIRGITFNRSLQAVSILESKLRKEGVVI